MSRNWNFDHNHNTAVFLSVFHTLRLGALCWLVFQCFRYLYRTLYLIHKKKKRIRYDTGSFSLSQFYNKFCPVYYGMAPPPPPPPRISVLHAFLRSARISLQCLLTAGIGSGQCWRVWPSLLNKTLLSCTRTVQRDLPHLSLPASFFVNGMINKVLAVAFSINS